MSGRWTMDQSLSELVHWTSARSGQQEADPAQGPALTLLQIHSRDMLFLDGSRRSRLGQSIESLSFERSLAQNSNGQIRDDVVDPVATIDHGFQLICGAWKHAEKGRDVGKTDQ